MLLIKVHLLSDSPNGNHTYVYIVLIVQGRLSVINGSSLQISIQSTKDATYRCRLNDGMYFPC